MSNGDQLCRGPASISIRKPPSSLAGKLPVLLACVPKLGCPLCWPALAALCSLCGLPFAVLNPLLLGLTLLAIALLLITAAFRHTFSWPSGLLLAGLLTNLGSRSLEAPVWVAYVATGLVFTALIAEFFLPGHFAMTAAAPHCASSCRTVSASCRSQEES